MNLSLQKFIDDRSAKYVEPSRSGTAKGELIGFSKQKHLSCLLCLTDRPLKEIAKAAKVSYPVLLKWRSEDVFKRTLEANIRDFVAVCYSEITSLLNKHQDADIVATFGETGWNTAIYQGLIDGFANFISSKNLREIGNAKAILKSLFAANSQASPLFAVLDDIYSLVIIRNNISQVISKTEASSELMEYLEPARDEAAKLIKNRLSSIK